MAGWGKLTTACVLVVGSAQVGVAAELIVMTNQGGTPGVKEVAAAFSQATGHKVTVLQETGAALEQRLANGPLDLFTANPEGVDDLVKKGKIVPGSAVPFAVASLGVAVRAGLPKPDISTVEAYKAALLAAKSIGYSRGCSGAHAAQGIAELGLTETLKPKTTFTGNGPVIDYLARGEFDLGIQQHNIMVGVPGTEFVGVPPGAMDKPCPSSIALMSSSKEPEAARAFIRFIASPAAAPLLRKTHVEPPKL
jgi:molybdate transport system substrate-binding protein